MANKAVQSFTTPIVKALSKKALRLDLAESKASSFVGRSTFRGPLQAAILDWSGTTADAHVIAPAVVFVDVFKKHGVPISMEEARGPMGLRKDLHIAKILEIPRVKKEWTKKFGAEPTQKDVDLLFADFTPLQVSCLPKYSTLLPGCVETVQQLKQEFNMKIGSTTGFTKCMVDILLDEAKKQGYEPDSSVAGDEVENNLGFRPAPFMLWKNLFKLGAWPIQSVIKCDDTVSGVGEGLNAGCWSVGIWGWSNYTDIDTMEQWHAMSDKVKEERREQSKQKLLQSGAHYLIETIEELPTVVKDVNQRLATGELPMSSYPLAK